MGDAKPRDESKFQERQRESERKEERKTPDRGNAGPKRGGFRNKHEGAEGRDFSQARSNMGKKPAPKAEEKKPKQSKPQTVQKESAAIKVDNIYSTLQNQEI